MLIKILIKIEVAISLLLMIALVNVLISVIPGLMIVNEMLLVLLSISLMGCTLKVQIPSWKLERVKRRWGKKEAQVQQGEKWNEYEKNQLAPIGIHMSMIGMMGGSMLDAIGGYTAQERIGVTEISHIQNVVSAGYGSRIGQEWNIRVNEMKISKEGEVRSEVEIIDNEGKSEWKEWISVNHPGKYKGRWIYQTDWKWEGVRIKRGEKRYECGIRGGICKWGEERLVFKDLSTKGMLYKQGKAVKEVASRCSFSWPACETVPGTAISVRLNE
jgi:hypothetical protein